MKFDIIILLVVIFLSKSMIDIPNVEKRLTYKEEFDEENTYYILNTEDQYKTIKNLEKSELITNSSSYTYEWSNHTSKTTVHLKNILPPSDSEGYRDMTKYDFIYLNMYSKHKMSSTIILIIECQKREPDSISAMRVCYKSYKIPINFSGWKEIKIPYTSLGDGYGADLSKVSGLYFTANGWGCVPNQDTILFIDKFFFTKHTYTFNMKESEIFEENYSTILNRFKYTLLSSGSIRNEKNEIILNRLKSIVKTAVKTHDGINKSGLPFSSPMKSTADMNGIYTKIKQMAIGYAIEGGQIYKDKEYFDDIVYCLDYMHENYYTKRSDNLFSSNNWWHWDIGIPQALVEIIVYIKEELNDKQINKYLSPLNKYIPLPSMTMANRADIAYSCIIAGALQKDYKRIAFSVELLRELFVNVESGDGFYDDGSFIQHTVYAYIGGYGSALIASLSKITYSLEGTCFMFDYEMKENQYKWITDSFIPFLYEGAFFDLVRGRGVDRTPQGLSTGAAVISSFFYITQYLKDEKNAKNLKKYLKNLYDGQQKFYNGSLTIGALGILEEIIKDEEIQNENINFNFAKVYSRMDKAIAQVNGVGIGISLSSTRIGRYESINGENKKGWYQGDGMTYIYLSPLDYASLFWPLVNLYRLPGTTVTTASREPKELSGNKALAAYDFVGGTYSNNNMVAAMQFSSNNTYGGFNSTLIGNKGYFLFENIFICIGNNISCDDNYNVETIIENRKITGKYYFGNKEITEKTGKITNNFIYIENYGGIYIPDYTNAKYNLTDNGFLEIYFDHGKKIKNSSYKYYLLPKIDKDDLKNYVNNIQIIKDNNKVTAIKNKLNNIIEYIFWEKGKIDNIEVDNPCTLIINRNYLYVSDPSQKLDYITITIGTDKYIIRVSKGYTNIVQLKKEISEN